MRSTSISRTGNATSLILVALILTGCATRPTTRVTNPTVVDAACGECLFGLPGKGCDLAVRIDGRSYYVDGINMDSLGDAHAKDGMCEVIRRAKVTGEVRKGRFFASSFELLPMPPR
jgi:hypothetical protein